jgi:hypothetical protein
VSEDGGWGTDTVSFGRPAEASPQESAPKRRPPRGPRRRPSRTAVRSIALGALGFVGLVAAIAALGGGGESSTAPLREAGPAPRVVVRPPTPPRGRARHHARKRELKPGSKGRLEGGKREPRGASPATHEPVAPEPEPLAEPEPEPAPVPVEEAEPEPVEPPAPMSPAAEFGM